MPMPTPDQVRDYLSGFGTRVENFNQNETGRAFPRDPNLTDGYCEGVTIDWIRRVLQGGRPSFSPRAVRATNPEETILRKKQSQAARQAAAFQRWVPTKERFAAQTPTRLREAERTLTTNKNALFDELDALEDY